MNRLRQAAALAKDTVIRARYVMTDPGVSRWRKAAIGGCIVYLASPIDLIPDFIPVLGWADDALVALLLLKLIRGASR